MNEWFVWFTVGYIAVSVLLYFLMRAKCRKNPIFNAPRTPALFYALSFTWGSPAVLAGGAVALILLLAGNRPKKYGYEWVFELPGINWGLELGIFFIAPKGGSEELRMHEHGHGIQNIYLGIFDIPVAFIPSVIRFWYREIRAALGKPCKTCYDVVWFERSASESGRAFFSVRAKQASDTSGVT